MLVLPGTSTAVTVCNTSIAILLILIDTHVSRFFSGVRSANLTVRSLQFLLTGVQCLKLAINFCYHRVSAFAQIV
jgi:hypothetical protein